MDPLILITTLMITQGNQYEIQSPKFMVPTNSEFWVRFHIRTDWWQFR